MNGMKLNVKGAVRVAMDYVRALEDLLPASQLRLEETMLHENGRWLMTPSYKEPDTFDSRTYKTFEVDPAQKEVVAMRIRILNGIDGGTF